MPIIPPGLSAASEEAGSPGVHQTQHFVLTLKESLVTGNGAYYYTHFFSTFLCHSAHYYEHLLCQLLGTRWIRHSRTARLENRGFGEDQMGLGSDPST